MLQHRPTLLWFAAVVLILVCQNAVAQSRYVAKLADGKRIEGEQLTDWHDVALQPKLDDQPLLVGDNRVVWLRDRNLQPNQLPAAFVEMVSGDRLPGEVVAFRATSESIYDAATPHFIVTPHSSINSPDPSKPAPLRVVQRFVRRVVWQLQSPDADRYEPGMVYFRDGRSLAFRAARFEANSVRLLLSNESRRELFTAIAEIHMPQQDPWDAYYDELAVLSPHGNTRLVQLETTGGLAVTASEQRYVPTARGDALDSNNWWHVVGPAWCLDAIWVPSDSVWIRRWFAPHQVPLPRISPTEILSGDGAWKWQTNRNVLGAPLHSGGLEHGWGIGVHAYTSLKFRVPAIVRSFRAQVGLDSSVRHRGCARARIFSGSPVGQPLFESPFLIGSQKVLDTGPIVVPIPDEGPPSLILQVDTAHQGRPEGADPFDIQDICDWLEPTLDLDSVQLKAELGRRTGMTNPVWKDWAMAPHEADGYALGTYFDSLGGTPNGHFYTTIQPTRQAVTFSRELAVGPTDRWLTASVYHHFPPSDGAEPPQIEVRVNDKTVARYSVPLWNGQLATPLAVDLSQHQGRTIQVQLVQTTSATNQPLHWRALRIVRELPVLHPFFEDAGAFVALDKDSGATLSLVENGAYSGRRAAKVTAQSRFRLPLKEPLLIRENPEPGQYRFLRFAFRKSGAGRICLEMEHEASAKKPARYDAGTDCDILARDVVWFDDSLPEGANAQAEGNQGENPWNWVTAPDNPVFSGKLSTRRSATGMGQHFFFGAEQGLTINHGDKLFAYAYLDPKDPPKEIMLQWNDGIWEHRAFWGEDLIPWGQGALPSRMYMGPLPEAGKWVRLEVEANRVGILPGAVINGWALTQFGGTMWWDKAGVNTAGAPSYGHARRVWALDLPDEWIVITRDLFADFGNLDVTGMTLTVPDGDSALFDHVYLARSRQDLLILKSAPEPDETNRAAQASLAATVFEQAIPAAVIIDIDGRSGTGVVIGKEGFVLTAGHFLAGTVKDATIQLADGRQLKAGVAGIFRNADCGLLKIVDDVKLTGLELSAETDFEVNQLYVGLVHVNSPQKRERSPAHVVEIRGTHGPYIWTDLDLEEPNVGGALLDRHGKVIGMHNRISHLGGFLYIKSHVIRERWARLTAGEVWGEWSLYRTGPMVGVEVVTTDQGCQINAIVANSPAAEADFMVGDIITKTDGQSVTDAGAFLQWLLTKDPDQEIAVALKRGEQTLEKRIWLMRRTP